MMRVIWSPQAIDDVAAISQFIARDAPAASVRWLEQLFKKVELLAPHPQLGSIVPEDQSRGYRQLLSGNYRVIYQIDEPSTAIRIITVIHAARLLDPSKLD